MGSEKSLYDESRNAHGQILTTSVKVCENGGRTFGRLSFTEALALCTPTLA